MHLKIFQNLKAIIKKKKIHNQNKKRLKKIQPQTKQKRLQKKINQ
jgi:hypothetical protein